MQGRNEGGVSMCGKEEETRGKVHKSNSKKTNTSTALCRRELNGGRARGITKEKESEKTHRRVISDAPMETFLDGEKKEVRLSLGQTTQTMLAGWKFQLINLRW